MKIKIKREVKIGFFAISILLLLYWGINFIKGKDIFNQNSRYYATYEQVSGIQLSSAIVVKGYKVGSISNISYDPSKDNNIVLEFTIKRKYKIPVNSRAHIFSDGLLGGKGVEIELGDSEFYLNNGDTLRSSMDKDFLEVAGSEFEFFKKKANSLVNEVMTTLGYVNTMLEKNTGYVTITTSNLAAISGSIKDVVASESNELNKIISNINTLSTKLNSSADKLDVILTGVNTFTDSLQAADMPNLVRSLAYTTEQLNTSVDKINNGDGTVGKLLNDPQLYDSLAEASDNLNKLMADIKANPERYVSISVFGRRNK